MAPGYIVVWHPPASCGRRICTEFNPSTGQSDIPISSTGCTCFFIDGSVEGQYVTLNVKSLPDNNLFCAFSSFIPCTICLKNTAQCLCLSCYEKLHFKAGITIFFLICFSLHISCFLKGFSFQWHECISGTFGVHNLIIVEIIIIPKRTKYGGLQNRFIYNIASMPTTDTYIKGINSYYWISQITQYLVY